MAKNPDGGQMGPPDNTNSPSPTDGQSSQSMAAQPTRAGVRVGGNGSSGASASGTQGGSDSAGPASGAASSAQGRTVAERKKRYLISPRQAVDGLATLAASPLSLSSVEQALRGNPDIEIVDTIRPRNVVGALADGMGSSQGVLVARMTDQKAGALHEQGQGRLLVERDQHLTMMDPALRQPTFVSSMLPSTGPVLAAAIVVVGKDGAPIADAEVSLFGSMLPASGVTDADGKVTLSLFGETATTVRGLYVKAKYDYWTFYQRDPAITTDEANVVTLRPLADWPSLANMGRQRVLCWGHKAMRVDQLPGNYRGQGIRVAIIDSGLATSHDQLNRVTAGLDIIDKATTPDAWNVDTLGHGSHCAGVIGAGDLAAGGVRSFAPEAEIHVLKLFPGGQISQLIEALEYCIEKQVDVVNLSLGGADPSETLERQIIRARRAGIACIVASGNSAGPVQYPASSPNVLAVGAIGKIDEFPPDSYHAETLSPDVDANGFFTAKFSCYGPQVGVCAPGVAIVSTVPPNNYAAWDGTSMATPHITGLAALVLAHHPDFQGTYKLRSAERVEHLFQIIKMSARRVSVADPSRIGFGMPDTLAAVGLQQPSQVSPQQAGVVGGIMGPQSVSAFGGFQRFPSPIDRNPFGLEPMIPYGGYFYPRSQFMSPTIGNPLHAPPLGVGTPGFNSPLTW
jgi:subtilisin